MILCGIYMLNPANFWHLYDTVETDGVCLSNTVICKFNFNIQKHRTCIQYFRNALRVSTTNVGLLKEN